jgi:hypothetical protein
LLRHEAMSRILALEGANEKGHLQQKIRSRPL